MPVMEDFPNNICRINDSEKGLYTYYPVLVVGAGESGIALGSRLREVLGFDQFRIFERQSGIGGTWWINRYPNVACDVPAMFYSFSFSLNPKWTAICPTGAEILQYFHEVCNKYRINDKIQLNTDVTEIRWLEDEGLWEVVLTHLAAGAGDLSSRDRQQRVRDKGHQSVYVRQEIVRAKIVVSAVGGLVEPNAWPVSVRGREDFQGEIFHSARWNSEVDLNGKNVVVVGTGCSAAQFVPALTKAPFNAKSVTQIMRSPPWVVPKISPPFGKENWEKWAPKLFSKVPGLARIWRLVIFFLSELDFHINMKDTPSTREGRRKTEAKLIHHMKNSVPERYHEILTPNYGLGCKRRIFDDYWFTAMSDPKFELTTRSLSSVQPRGITLGPERMYPDPSDMTYKAPMDEITIPADVIILSNGFETTTWLHPLKVRGRSGALLQDVWDERGGAQAYMGTAMDGFPNFFMVVGPNTVTGHSSVILASENMISYALKFIRPILAGDVKTVEVKKEAEMAWTTKIQEDLKSTIYSSYACKSWYKTESGWNPSTYPYSQIDYSVRCMFPKWRDWDFQYTSKGKAKKMAKRFLLFAVPLLVVISLQWARKDGRTNIGILGLFRESLRRTLLNALYFIRIASDPITGKF